MSLPQQIGSVAEYALLRSVLKCCNAAESFISSLVRSFNGSDKNDLLHTSSKTKHGLANLQKIFWRAKPHEAVDANPERNFILKHSEWVEPDFVLKENVSLFGVSQDGSSVSFTMTSSDLDVYSSDQGPFMYITQFKLATHLITMDVDTFKELAETLPEKDVKVIIVANTGRCGSTLLAQMFEEVKGARVLSEPHSLLDALYLHNRSVIDHVTYAILVKSIMKVHIACATTREDIKILVFKPVFKCTPQIKLMIDGFSDTSVIFLYRTVKETVGSFMRVMAAFTKFANLFTDMNEMMDYWLSDLPLPLPKSTYKWAREQNMLLSLSLPSAIALNWCATVVCIRDYIDQGTHISCLDYKDLVKSPDQVWNSLRRFCNLSETTSIPLEAYQKDSQRGAFLSRGVLATTEGKKNRETDNWLKDLTKFEEAFELDEDLQFLPALLA